MGRNNQQRRAEKKRRSERSERRSGSGYRAGSHGSAGDQQVAAVLEVLAFKGAHAAAAGSEEGVDAACAGLEAFAEKFGAGVVSTSIGLTFCEVLSAAWEGGWQPAEVARQVRRRRRGAHQEVLSAAMGSPSTWQEAGTAAMPEPWAAQLDDLGVSLPAPPARDGAPADWLGAWTRRTGRSLDEALPCILETLGVLLLPVVESVVPPPSAWDDRNATMSGHAPDDPVLAKVRALLAKAESTAFEAESEALTAKAQELMARHAIDEALARAQRAGRERPVARRLAVDDPYATAKSRLLQIVGDANGVRCVWYERYAMMALVGFEADLDAVEVLFTSLLVQGSRAMLAKGSVTDGRGRSRTRSFRQSFLVAFADRIHERLATATRQARAHAEDELHTSLLPVLADRDREVDEALEALFPHLTKSAGPGITNEAGWRAGRTAAEMATLGPEQGMLDGMRATA